MDRMKKLRIYFSKKKLFARTFLSVCVIAFAAILAVTSIVFFWYRKKSAEDYRSLARISVSNTDIVFSQYIQSSVGLVKNWYYTADGQECRMDRVRQTARHMGFINEMRQMVSTVPYVQSVSILNYRGEEMLFFGTGLVYTQELEKPFFLELKKKEAPKVGFAWNVKSRYDDQPDVPLLTVYFQEAEPGDVHYCGTVAMHLDARMLGKSIFSSADQTDFQIFIIDEEGRVAVGSASSCCGEDWSEKEFMNEIRNGQTGPFYEEEADGSESELVAMPSAMKGYYIVARAKAGETAGTAGRILNVLLGSGLLVSVFIFISTLLLCMRLYRPFYGMLSELRQSADQEGQKWDTDEVQFLYNFYNGLTEHISELSQKTEKEAVIKALLMGGQDLAIREYLLEKKIVQEGECFYAVLLSICRDAYQDANSGEYDALRSMGGTIYTAKLGEIGRCASFEMGPGRILVLLAKEGGHEIEESALSQCLDKAQNMVSEIKGVRVYAVVSEKMKEASSFDAKQYKSLEERLASRQILGEEEALFCGRLKEEEFPGEVCGCMAVSIKSRDAEAYQDFTEEFLKCCSRCAYPIFLSWNTEASWELFGIERALRGKREDGRMTREEIREHIKECRSREELLLWYGNIYQKLKEELGRTDEKSLDDSMERAVAYIREHYDDVDLNVNMLADILGISTAYFGKLFKEYAGCSMVEYLKKVRMEKAYQMLLEHPGKSVAQIAREAGFGNPAYFTTLFKKFYGISPSKFKDANRMNGS